MNLIKGADGNRDWNQVTKCNGFSNTAMMWEMPVYLGWSSSGLKKSFQFQEATRIPIEPNRLIDRHGGRR